MHKRCGMLLTLLLCCLLCLAARAEDAEDPVTLRALLVGCDEFLSHENIAPSAEMNVRRMANMLATDIRGYAAIVSAGQGVGSVQALRELMQKEIEAQRAEQQTAIREEGRVEVGEAGDLAFLFDEAAADDLMNVLEHADCRSCGNQEILKIILDEADAFFKGRKTAQEAAQVMDRRAALFIAEAG